jgi:hypothetical protein
VQNVVVLWALWPKQQQVTNSCCLGLFKIIKKKKNKKKTNMELEKRRQILIHSQCGSSCRSLDSWGSHILSSEPIVLASSN